MFCEKIRLRRLDRTDDSGRRLYRLTKEYMFCFADGFTITVPRGFITNLGTIPRCLWWFIKPSELGEASVVHDYLLQENAVRKKSGAKPLVSRWLADAVFYEAMERIQIPLYKRIPVFLAVRFFSFFK